MIEEKIIDEVLQSNKHSFSEGKFSQLQVELRPLKRPDGSEVGDIFDAWIWLDNPSQYNSYTTETLRQLCLALDWASCRADINCIILTAVGEKAFCTGGNTVEYENEYSWKPQEYRTYMGVFNRMVSLILENEKPVINRVNGMRIAGGQEMGLACDFTISSDLARYGQAGPKHGSAPDGGSTDFLDLYVGFARSIESCVLCEQWSAHKAMHLGLVNEIVPVLQDGSGNWVANPMVTFDWVNSSTGQIVFGDFLVGEEAKVAKELKDKCTIDFSRLDAAVAGLSWKLANTFPGCTRKTLSSVRKKKLHWWDSNRESNREWLALNMAVEAAAGFRAFNVGGGKREDGSRIPRQVDFIEVRQAIARGEAWTPELVESFMPHQKE
ncbi:MAG TPA: 6-oxocyclohex-1-ene-1-carbonyl-CoA hydratase [Candidatus Thalassarchaeaceae archaeon]|jgi:6-oxo-cyclohex-1-ene-carbonyl-CoA hydrolase|nr:enoyl-CoA hydratase-related protein [Candidatus Thalassarchaeaceae archaeon]MDP7043769.1 enoyl-CoA hydratase-related protein [Candidatus Thalassarchaeaceae archaeon]HIH82565.1 6-oxocyclohex-1-ene-1-carbonyl-CoA hydratase [Candidatus Thalassarchaeaceae archaeon]|tara:strand:- start:3281 stop:4423 length:1143 start_codon:yes stop_codon:yes gene_type:complete